MFAKSKYDRALDDSQLSEQELQLVAGGVYTVEKFELDDGPRSIGSIGDGTIGGVGLPGEPKAKLGEPDA
jgi:hypothetical protein